MENATKALIIAAAVLVAIIIIAFGLRIINAGKGTLTQGESYSKDMEVSVINSKFEALTGNNIEASSVRKLARKVTGFNETNANAIYLTGISTSSLYTSREDIKTNIIDKVNDNKLYTVVVSDYYTNGLIRTIKITK